MINLFDQRIKKSERKVRDMLVTFENTVTFTVFYRDLFRKFKGKDRSR